MAEAILTKSKDAVVEALAAATAATGLSGEPRFPLSEA